jgi:pyruvate/2-oxoglutarate/acetoin dehydrogenase E1 component/TPP-dependent pyruvate/acetoin dehydrogenase alpha subunit
MTKDYLHTVSINSYSTLDDTFLREIREDYWICRLSREVSLLGRREVLSGKAKFGIFGDGKEVAQVAMSRAFKKGDWRAGYYRDQTIIFALGLSTVQDFFAQLYADTQHDKFSGGRQMNGHYATPIIDEAGNWLNLAELHNISADISCTAGQMPRAVGLAFASKLFRKNKALSDLKHFSKNGNEVCFCTIGDASTSEGVFWEAMNAAGVLQIPLAVSVWDDGYGISVPIEYQTTKASISAALSGLQRDEDSPGIDIYTIKGWSYLDLRAAYDKGIQKMRQTHIPALFHIQELTQPQGHSTSGSHERYKSDKRLAWEKQHDCLTQMENWMLSEGITTEEELIELQQKAKKEVREARDLAWEAYIQPIQQTKATVLQLYSNALSSITSVQAKPILQKKMQELKNLRTPFLSEIVQNVRQSYFTLQRNAMAEAKPIKQWLDKAYEKATDDYASHLYSNSAVAAIKIAEIKPKYSKSSEEKNGYEIINTFFDKVLAQDKRIVAFGEDVGNIGDVNQGFAGLQKKYGEDRIFDTGIRELTIMGQAIGLAMRGLRPIAEIQYLDYLVYGLQPLTDDLACLRWRTDGKQQAPVIIRTRGHRLEGIWHAGSPIGMIINSLRGMCVLVPRNMTQAAGMYNTMLQSDDPALIIESLNGYRLKELMPDNIGQYTVPIGQVDILHKGNDITLVTYGSCVRIAEKALHMLSEHGISVELIDVQSLVPFDLSNTIVQSLKKTNRVIFMDEDVPGGATAYMMQQVLEQQKGYQFLDASPVTITAKAHRCPYGSDGDYFTKPNAEDVFEAVYQLMME